MLNIIKKIIGSKNDRELKKLWPAIERINGFEPTVSALTNEQLRAKTDEFKQRIHEQTAQERGELDTLLQQQGESPERLPADEDESDSKDLRSQIDEAQKTLRQAEGRVLDEILPEAFAVVREASKRTTGLRHFDVQFIGGMVQHRGSISEMKTGEGKTLVATGPLYLNALTGRGCHLVTVNDYLARRDVQWMGPIFHLLGISVASIVHEASYLFDPTYVVRDYRMLNLRPIERKEAYLADITYGTNHEFGFDYLRDNMKFTLEEYVQRELNFAIVDEVDNILIDEARTPLIISGPAEESTDKYYVIDRLIPRLRKGERKEKKNPDDRPEETGDFWVDEKSRSAVLTEQGIAKVERMLGVTNLYDPRHIDTLHHVNQALKAHAIFQRDVDYIVKDGQVIIVDEFTGRLMPGRRWSDGLHQAVEAKEAVRIERENQTLATITIQNYFRMYHKLAGMTGTADTESVEFQKIYKLEVIVIPPNRMMVRNDMPDVVYKTEREKFNAVIEQVTDCYEKGQPVLVGTVSVEKSERLAKMLKKDGIKHNVLNAVNHEAEANIIAQAGRHKAVTIATNMAGRGTDILLGGNPEYLARSDMEHEWLQRAQGLPEGGQRYEDVLQKLKDRLDDAVAQARAQYEPLWKPFEEQQADALNRLADSHLAYLEAAFWKRRTAFEQQMQLVRTEPTAASAGACAEAMEAYSGALQEVDRVSGPYFGEEGQQRFSRALEELQSALSEIVQEGNSNGTRLSAAQAAFERTRGEYERAVQKALTASITDGSNFEEAERVYYGTEQEFRQAEASYNEHRKPYEEAVAAAQRDYEDTRRKYTKVVEDVREEMEKAPVELRSRYDDVLAKYKQLCAEEREKVLQAGGLMIMGTERHESRRIDNQLRGRAGRQGDPGASRFYLSLEDDLLRIFGAERIQGLMTRLGMEEGEPIEHRLIDRAVANAQSKVEGHNFDIRKHLIEYDDVMNQQREIVYGRRRDILGRANLKADVLQMAGNVAEGILDQYANRETHADEWEWQALSDTLFKNFAMRLQISDVEKETIRAEALERAVIEQMHATYDQKEQSFTPPVLRHLEKLVLLQTLDSLWKDHLLSMDHLKEGINLRGYGQRDPLQEYKKEAFELFEELMRQFEADVVEKIFTVQIARQEDVQRLQERQRPQPQQMVMSGGSTVAGGGQARKAQPAHQEDKVGRNDPCPCGSGKKYKKCHGT
ncbi:MAG: preprotein translocase subunit SecA [Deltaproteobacteria bacterium]|nr:preprotein translocase subunit SecA [Deltaproteobacteria bacterium]